jgi:ABC-type nitrate/sulfonate/bicarbonate transport system ATPase subunit
VVRLGSVRGLVFHEDTLLPWLTVVENVTLAPKNFDAVQDRARALLAEFGLSDALRAYPHELSAGMRKRVEFARALLSDDRLLLLDEPFVSLDRETRSQLWNLWRSSDGIASRTKMIVTHDMEEVRAIADDVILFEAGRPVAVSATFELRPVGNETPIVSEQPGPIGIRPV